MSDFEAIKAEIEKSKNFSGIITLNEPIASKTTFKIGGNAPIYFEPQTPQALIFILQTLDAKKIPHFILGGGSNIVVSDKGFEGAVISTTKLSSISANSSNETNQNQPCPIEVTCESGCSISSFINFCKENSITKCEEFAGLPGSIGGAVFMNARCFELSISDILKSVSYLDKKTLQIKQYDFLQDDWDYKKSPFQNGDTIILNATFSLQKDESKKTQIAARCLDYINQRVNKGHFKFPSAGSVFVNNHNFGSPSGKIIDECGLRGTKIGGAQVAPWHGNFIINTGNATQKDVLALVDLITREVKQQKGFELTPEIIFCGRE